MLNFPAIRLSRFRTLFPFVASDQEVQQGSADDGGQGAVIEDQAQPEYFRREDMGEIPDEYDQGACEQ